MLASSRFECLARDAVHLASSHESGSTTLALQRARGLADAEDRHCLYELEPMHISSFSVRKYHFPSTSAGEASVRAFNRFT